MDKDVLKKVEETFLIRKIKEIKPISTGNINYTYKIKAEHGDNYILQKINENVFPRPDQVMQNIRRVCRFVEKKILYKGGNPKREVLHPIATLDGTSFLIDKDGKYWRMYDLIEGAITYDTVDDEEKFKKVGGAYGEFQDMLSDFDASKLHEAIKDFHNTPKRLLDLKKAIIADKAGRLEAIKNQPNHPLKQAIDYLLNTENDIWLIEGGKASGDLPMRVTHNDTKINNIMFDKKTGNPMCVIDYDTIGPDSWLVDFGDAIRSGANRAGEEPENIKEGILDLGLFKAFSQGYLSKTLKLTKDGKLNENPNLGLTKNEVLLLHKAPRILTLELAMRFITDYINGDEYFKPKEGQPEDINLKRGLVQLHLAEDMRQKENEMEEIINQIVLEKMKDRTDEER